MALPKTGARPWKKLAAGHSTDLLAIAGSLCSFCSRQPPRSAIQHCGGPFFQANDYNDYNQPLAGAGASEDSRVGSGRRQPGSSGCVRRDRCCRCNVARHPGWILRTGHQSLPQRCKVTLQHRLEKGDRKSLASAVSASGSSAAYGTAQSTYTPRTMIIIFINQECSTMRAM
jgi:hypothetical protein